MKKILVLLIVGALMLAAGSVSSKQGDQSPPVQKESTIKKANVVSFIHSVPVEVNQMQTVTQTSSVVDAISETQAEVPENTSLVKKRVSSGTSLISEVPKDNYRQSTAINYKRPDTKILYCSLGYSMYFWS